MTSNYTLGPHSCRPFWARWPQRTLRREKASFPHFLQELSTFSRVYFDFWFFFLSLPRKLLHATGCLNQRADTHTPPPLFPLLSPPACSHFQFSPAPCLLSLPAEVLGTCECGVKATVFPRAILNHPAHKPYFLPHLQPSPLSTFLNCSISRLIRLCGHMCVLSVCVGSHVLIV